MSQQEAIKQFESQKVLTQSALGSRGCCLYQQQ